ncbi:GntR family transcriptional regulator [Pilimelia terevasa]|uniref:GntR family transcriptional regulator n=1 Tax=Pilimelia terevasa TaxID=53372 RepID=A0A8J3FFB5_9ACTN|nr:GntR family transcriptional regulator [Pilimelia terevasa]GGK17473.1 GntR family transcriptional regulator [Pilimelia terevasa]
MDSALPTPERRATADAHHRPPAYQVLADDLRTQITTGRLRPGDRLPTEPELCARSGVSRSTVREALRMLASQHLIVTTRGVFGGSFVAEPCPARLADSLTGVLQLLCASGPPSAERSLEVRLMLEVPGAGLAASRRTESHLARLAQLVVDPILPLPTRFAVYEEFHGVVAVAVQNPLYELLTRPLHRLSVVDRLTEDAGVWTRVAAYCRDFAARLREGDVMGAQEAAADHLRHLRTIGVVRAADPVAG